MTETYSNHADVCAKFYSLTLDPDKTADFIFKNSRAVPGLNALFIGGMFDIADGLQKRGINISLVDYTEEMVAIGKSKFPDVSIFQADLRDLPFSSEFDIIYVIGRVFTHMISDNDLSRAILSCRKSLKNSGYLFADNYEDTRIQLTGYFNGQVECSDSTSKIIRDSATTRISDSPYIVRWHADYSGHINGADFHFSDSMDHRAFSRTEFADELKKSGFSVEQQGDNFDETSFYTLARKAV